MQSATFASKNYVISKAFPSDKHVHSVKGNLDIWFAKLTRQDVPSDVPSNRSFNITMIFQKTQTEVSYSGDVNTLSKRSDAGG